MNILNPTLTPDGTPEVSRKLINWLAASWPDKLPSTPPESLTVGARLIGQQDVIRRLRQEMERQEG